MSAVNPLPSPDSAADKRAYEPSMEEILASIRRIIADDQSLPGRGPREPEPVSAPVKKELRRPTTPDDPAPAAAAVHPPVLRPERPAIEPPRAERVSPAEQAVPVETRPVAVEPLLDASLAHGAIAAPQFAMPDGPVAEERYKEPEPEAFVAAPPEPRAAETPVRQAEPADASEPDDSPYDRPIMTPPPPAASREAPRDNPALFSAATDSAVAASFNMLAASRLADNSDELMTLARDMIRPLLRSWIDDNLPSMVERMVRAEIERVARGGR